jgi:hypothetical protein
MQKIINKVSAKTNQRWWLIATLTILGMGVLASSVYFLVFPLGYQGGRNAHYGFTFLFSRDGWDALHLWTGLGMILVVLAHNVVHWQWIKMMVVRCLKPQTCNVAKNNWRAQYNLFLNLVAGISFLLVSASGIYLMFMSGRSNAESSPVFIFNWYAWDVIHTWSGIVMVISVFLHFYIHWGWVVNVSKKMLKLERTNQNLTLEGGTND